MWFLLKHISKVVLAFLKFHIFRKIAYLRLPFMLMGVNVCLWLDRKSFCNCVILTKLRGDMVDWGCGSRASLKLPASFMAGLTWDATRAGTSLLLTDLLCWLRVWVGASVMQHTGKWTHLFQVSPDGSPARLLLRKAPFQPPAHCQLPG